jgi:hypothetical protein
MEICKHYDLGHIILLITRIWVGGRHMVALIVEVLFYELEDCGFKSQ